jgi:hypothetical protein
MGDDVTDTTTPGTAAYESIGVQGLLDDIRGLQVVRVGQ